MKGTIRAICISERKGTPKRPVERAECVADHGLAGDAHAGAGPRQVSLLDYADVCRMREALPDLRFGAFGENLVIDGIDCASLGLGTALRLGGKAQVRISQIGKVCHSPCAIYQSTGDCIMPRAGLFARVVTGGPIAAGDVAEVVEFVDRRRLQAAIVTVSDRCSRGEAIDTAGPAVAALLEERLGAHVYATEIVPDEINAISARLKHYCNGHSIDLVLTVGGTGFGPRDVTPEATRPLVERFTPGLDEAMRMAGLSKTPRAILSRGVSGIRGRTLIVNLPGSQRGATESLEAILSALDHGLRTLRGQTRDCGEAAGTSER